MSLSPFQMMDPPSSDRNLDVDGVRRVVGDQFPDLDLASVEHLGSGWEHDVYLVDGAIVFRFPRYGGVAEGLDYDQAVHDLVGSFVGESLSVPRIALHGRPCPGFPHRFVGHELIPRLGADAPAASPLSMELASDLGQALASIHAISPEAARAVGVGVAGGNCEESFLALMRQVPLVPALQDSAPGPFAWLSGQPDVPPEFPGPPRFIMVLRGKAFLEAALESLDSPSMKGSEGGSPSAPGSAHWGGSRMPCVEESTPGGVLGRLKTPLAPEGSAGRPEGVRSPEVSGATNFTVDRERGWVYFVVGERTELVRLPFMREDQMEIAIVEWKGEMDGEP